MVLIYLVYNNQHLNNQISKSMNHRKVFMGGNWKCNNTLVQTKQIVETVVDKLEFDPEKVGNFSLI